MKPRQHFVEGMTHSGEVMADRVQIIDVAARNAGRNRSCRTYRPLAPVDLKIVEPRVEYSAADLHDKLTSWFGSHDVGSVRIFVHVCCQVLSRAVVGWLDEETNTWPSPWGHEN